MPLKGGHFDAFAALSQREEWRRFGPRWNIATCRIGRAVVLSRGYSGARLLAEIEAVTIRLPDTAIRRALFGPATRCIVLRLRDIRPLR